MASRRRPPFVVLFREFFSQFFTSETVSSDDQLRQTLVWVVVFLFLPGVMLMVQLLFEYAGVVIRAIKLQQFDRLDDTIEWIAFLYITYSMVTVGFIAVVAWDGLTFDRRDAMVLGPLPLPGATIVTAKLAALGAFLLAAAAAVNLPNACVFAAVTGDQLGAATVVTHFIALLTATSAGAAFVFASLVVLRGAIGLVARPRLAVAVGSLLQFAFVLALLALVILCPAVARIPHSALVNPTVTGWLPASWFLGLFERMRGSTRAYFQPLAARALPALAAAVALAVLTSVAGFGRQMQTALAPSAAAGAGGGARFTRALAQRLVRRNPVAVATSDFMLLTLARSRAQQLPIAMNAAVGVAVVLAALTQVQDFASLTRPRTVILWIPLVLAYWTTIGMRAAFFVPSELASSWTFSVNAPAPSPGYWSAVRAVTLAVVLPPMLALTAILTVPLFGWSVAVMHALVTCAVVALLAESMALSIDFVPFTRPYAAGHAKLRTRWPLYVLGMYLFAIWPARLELRILGDWSAALRIAACAAAAIAFLEWRGRRRAAAWMVDPRDEPPDVLSGLRVLNLGGPMKRAAVVSLLLTIAGFSAGCGPAVDVAKNVQVEAVSTGWMNAGVVDGRNKLVPAVRFTVKNLSDQKLPALQVNAVFRRVNQTEGWGDGFRSVAGSDGLAPGAATPLLTIEAQLGYTGLDPADALLRNSQFVDAKVDVFAKYGSNQWARLGEYPVARQLLARQP